MKKGRKRLVAKPLMIVVGRSEGIIGKNSRKIEARHVRRFRYLGFRLFAHQYEEARGKWRVSEFTTGYHIPKSFAETRAKAIEQAKAEIDRVGIEGANLAIARVIHEEGIANK